MLPPVILAGGGGLHTNIKQLIIIRRDLHMRKGKIAAQAGHACVEALLMALGQLKSAARDALLQGEAGDSDVARWLATGEAKVCVYVDSLDELLAVRAKLTEAGIATSLIVDAGKTEFHGEATVTCIATVPTPAELLDPITGSLPLF